MEEFGPTKAIYLHEETKHTSVSKVLASVSYKHTHDEIKSIFKSAADADHLVVTDSTIFYAKGGGQPSDIGHMAATEDGLSTFLVKVVHKLPSGTILHLGSYSNQPFEPQATVLQEINIDVRTLHSRIHDAGHILASAVRSLNIPGIQELKAQHYPDVAFVDFKGMIPGDKKEEIERLANNIVDEDRSIIVHWWSRDQLEEKSWTMPEDFDDNQQLFRAVDIQGAGAYMCGGTHVRSTGLVGKLRIRKIKRQQGVTRVSYELAL
ncbi:Threonyl/alanyl tRNA synthetase [Dactylonectria macrodidyma]|uniref:Threonyl/alanyl tRNA synthetase n=1 Tax=Dactylonectria macrodidyma TaxID=307937 RepID=A0A9P9FRI3_9HYPO|nr:Threonyl/alanyl tRNA synthetase [Dactylonectria macrodidyma]